MSYVCQQFVCKAIRRCSGQIQPFLLMSTPRKGIPFPRESSAMARAIVREEEGDLFRASSSTSLAHCVSSDMRMGAGIAVLFRTKFGRVEQLKNQNKSVGEVAYLTEGARFIFYLVTKQWFYDKPTLTTLRNSLLELRELCERFRVRKLAMPRIGCGLDGLQWPIVFQMVKKIFEDCGMEITIYSIPDRRDIWQRSATPNPYKPIHNIFDNRGTRSLPSSEMSSKRKILSFSSEQDYETPKKRIKLSPSGPSSTPMSGISWHTSRNSTSDRSRYSDGSHNSSLRNSKELVLRQTTLKTFLTPVSGKGKNIIPFLSDEEEDEGSKTKNSRLASKRFSFSLKSDSVLSATKDRKKQDSPPVQRYASKKRGRSDSSSSASDDDETIIQKKGSSSSKKYKLHSRKVELSSDDSGANKPVNKSVRSQHSPGSENSSSNEEEYPIEKSKRKEPKSWDPFRSRKSLDSGEDRSKSKKSSSRDPSESREKKSRHSTQSYESKVYSSSKDKEIKAWSSSERKSRSSGEGKSRSSGEKKSRSSSERKYRSSSKSMEKKPRSLSDSKKLRTSSSSKRKESESRGLKRGSKKSFESNWCVELKSPDKHSESKTQAQDDSASDDMSSVDSNVDEGKGRSNRSFPIKSMYSDKTEFRTSVKSRLSFSRKS